MGQRRKAGDVRISRLPKGVQHAGATSAELMQERSSVPGGHLNSPTCRRVKIRTLML